MKREWINRCARRLHKNQGLKWQSALSRAAELARIQSVDFGESGVAWGNPEDVADDDA